MEELRNLISEREGCVAIYDVFPQGHKVLIEFERELNVLREALDIMEIYKNSF